jgi:hypothetical protein
LPVAVDGVVETGSLPLIGCFGLVIVLGSLTGGSFLSVTGYFGSFVSLVGSDGLVLSGTRGAF